MNSLLVRLLLVVSIALLPALGASIYNEFNADRIRRALVKDQVLRLVRTVSSEQQRIVEGADQVLSVLTGAPAVRDGNHETCRNLLRSLLVQAPRYLTASIVGPDGRIQCSPSGYEGRDVSGTDFFQSAVRTDGLVVGGYSSGPVSGLPTVHFTRAFRDAGGRLAGVAVLVMKIDWLSEHLNSMALPPSAMSVITDRNGVLLARRPSIPEAIGQPIAKKYEFTLHGTEPGVFEMMTLHSPRPLILAYSPPDATPVGWSVGVGLDKDIVYAEEERANLVALQIIAAATVLSLLATAVAGTRIIRRPFKRLLAVADRWGSGDLSARTGIANDGSEFGRLANAFDAMAGAHEARERARRSALESTTDSVVVVDPSGQIAYLNQRATAQLAHSRAAPGAAFAGVFSGEDDAIFLAAYQQALATGTAVRLEGSHSPLGRLFVVNAYPSQDGVSLFFRDVTEEQRTAAALRESEEQYRATFEQAPVGMAQHGMDGRWLRVNDTLCAITGYRSDELLGRDFKEITHPEDREICPEKLAALMSGDVETMSMEKRYIRKDGAVVWVDQWLSLLRDASGKPERFLAILQDITERKAVRDALEASETRLQLAREAAGFGVWDWDLVTGLRTWSDQHWRLRGLAPRPGGIDDATWRAGIHPEDQERVDAEIAAARADPARPVDSVYRVIRPDGAIRWLLVKAKVVRDDQCNALRMVGVSMDVTESRETEASLRRLTTDLEARVQEEIGIREAAQARAAHAERMQALGQLAAGIAHDFNNVLQMVLGAASLIEAEPNKPAEVAGLAQLIMEASDQGAATTRRLLSLGRRGDLRTESVEVGPLLAGLKEILTHTLGTGIAIAVEVDNGVRAVLADKAQLETSLVNLAINARDAMPGGGVLTLSATGIAAGAYRPEGIPDGRLVKLSVTDTGTGMDAATLARVGEPFFTTKKLGAGNGLGVAMVKGFTEQSGGGMRVESRPGAGTTVTLWLPAADGEAAARPSGASEPEEGDTPPLANVLLVEDEVAVRTVIARHLHRAGFRVAAAGNGPAALAMLDAGEPIDILVTDLSMPGMDGVSVISAVQQRKPQVPAVLLTGYAGDGVNLAISGAVAGTYSLLRKPVRGPQLVDRMRALLAGRTEAADRES